MGAVGWARPGWVHWAGLGYRPRGRGSVLTTFALARTGRNLREIDAGSDGLGCSALTGALFCVAGDWAGTCGTSAGRADPATATAIAAFAVPSAWCAARGHGASPRGWLHGRPLGRRAGSALAREVRQRVGDQRAGTLSRFLRCLGVELPIYPDRRGEFRQNGLSRWSVCWDCGVPEEEMLRTSPCTTHLYPSTPGGLVSDQGGGRYEMLVHPSSTLLASA